MRLKYSVLSLSLTGKDSGAELEDSMFTPRREKPVDRMQYDDLMAEYLKLAEAMKVIKKELATLQDLVSTNIAFCFDRGNYHVRMSRAQTSHAGPDSSVGCQSAWYSDGHRFDPPVQQNILSWSLVMKSFLRQFCVYR